MALFFQFFIEQFKAFKQAMIKHTQAKADYEVLIKVCAVVGFINVKFDVVQPMTLLLAKYRIFQSGPKGTNANSRDAKQA